AAKVARTPAARLRAPRGLAASCVAARSLTQCWTDSSRTYAVLASPRDWLPAPQRNHGHPGDRHRTEAPPSAVAPEAVREGPLAQAKGHGARGVAGRPSR